MNFARLRCNGFKTQNQNKKTDDLLKLFYFKGFDFHPHRLAAETGA